MAIVRTSNRANLSAEFLEQNWNVPQILRNDYIASNNDVDNLFQNDSELDDRLVTAEDDIDALEIDVAANTANIATNSANISTNTSNIAANTANIATNTANIAANTSAITDINDGRYSPQFGSGSPEGVVTANRNQTYFDTSVPSMWVNPTIGANTGWVQVV